MQKPGSPKPLPIPHSFPPRRDYSSLSVRDLLDARDAYHVYLASLEHVVSTAIGRYRIHKDDWYATHPPDTPRPKDVGKIKTPRTLGNSIVRPWSWPAVLVFVKQWEDPDALGNQLVPRTLYLSDGRVVPTCVIEAKPDESPPPPVPGPSTVSPMLGGGYSCLRRHQGTESYGTFACLVSKEGSYYALTNRHVAGAGGDVISAYLRGEYHPVGKCADMGMMRIPFPSVFPAWGCENTLVTLDAGLVRIDNFEDWTSQVFGIGEIGQPFNATEQTITLDLIGCPVRAFGGASGVIEGEVQALFYRYESLGGYDYTTDVLIGPRGKSQAGVAVDAEDETEVSAAPFTEPGDSGTLWFYDPPDTIPEGHEDIEQHTPPERGVRARRLRPIAMQWGGQRFEDADQSSSAFALGSFVSTISRALDVGIVRDWSIGHDEYWGKLGHFAIGWKACDQLQGRLSQLMRKNQKRIGFGDTVLGEGSEFRMGRGAFVPLADVPDYVWVHSKPNESVQHFADIDIYSINGGDTMLEMCHADHANVSAKKWKQYFDGFKNAGVGPEEGALPFRVWQLWDAMVEYLRNNDVIHFVAAAGVLGHYIGDASQPLHCSYMHHGKPPMTSAHGRKYPYPRSSPQFAAFKETREYLIHAIYEQQMLEVDTPTALAKVNDLLNQGNPHTRNIRNGHDAAVETVELMYQSQQALSPQDIFNADKPSLSKPKRSQRLWNNTAVLNATVKSLAESVFLLADLWTSAWEAGDGDSIATSELVRFSEDDIEDIYRGEDDFVPSLSLKKMAQSGDFEPSP